MPEKEKTEAEKLADKLLFTLKNSWEAVDETAEAKIENFAQEYKQYLDNGKTERECVDITIKLLESCGFVNVDTVSGEGKGEGLNLAAGTKIYQNIRGKSLIACIIGKKSAAEGFNILGAHIDSPRLDLKQNPLYEDSDFALLDTHYYGGIKKYQWTAIPLAMHGVFITADGKKITCKIGEEPGEPVFTVTDLLPHLAKEQMDKKLSEAVEAENLDILAGSRPYIDKEAKDKVKLKTLELLHKKYGITEKDFARAEIEFVPAFKASDVGFDCSMVGAYGQDDRSCAFPAIKTLEAVAQSNNIPEKTIVLYLSDKEETGSAGNTGARSVNFENFISFLCSSEKEKRLCCSRSSMLSADVNAAFDPTYSGVFDKKNSSYMGKGIALSKYTGSGGKYGASDANAEFCAKVQNILDTDKVPWQFGALGKVDKGGGGTIALYAANLGMEVLDCGVPTLSMHSPFEVTSKVDLFNTYRAYMAFVSKA